MPHLWQDLPCWRILDTGFSNGRAFLETWLSWREDARAPQMLHYVAFCQQPVAATALIRDFAADLRLQPLAQQLSVQWFGLLPGFHRFLLDQGRVVLTLCVGDTLALLRQQHFAADAIMLAATLAAESHPREPWDTWAIKALARCCRRGTTLRALGFSLANEAELRHLLTQCGFALAGPSTNQSGIKPGQMDACFDPPWDMKNTRQSALVTALPIQRCAVVGAGLAGASVAASLARRGWQVQVLDQAAEPAAAASGLPVGLVVPHVSSDDCALSRLSRAGVRMMLQQAGQWLKRGQDWEPSGVLERQVGGTPRLPANWTDAGQQWATPYPGDSASASELTLGPGIWHHRGAWLKPAQLVRAWLSQPGVVFQGNAPVSRLRHQHGVWDLLDNAGQVLCSAERVVFANASGAQTLLQTMQSEHPTLATPLTRMPAMQGMRGLLSWATHGAPEPGCAIFPPFPVNGSGSVIANIPMTEGHAWFMGSSYQPERQSERSDQDNHLRNFEHLQKLLPAQASALETSFAASALNTWKNTRCVTADRLPLVGPIDQGAQPSLWLCAGLGSRGMSFSVLCAELLAARWGGEPLPIEANLAKSLEALRA